MSRITFTVREIDLRASGLGRAVGYTVEVDLTDDPTTIDISVLSTLPADPLPGCIEYAVKHTREGFAEVLEPMGH